MIKFKPYNYVDNKVFGCEAFSMLVPEEWVVSGGITWRQHATMPGAINISIRSSDGEYQLNLLPSKPYYWSHNPFSFLGPREGTEYMGNEVRCPVSGYLDYLEKYILPKGRYSTRIIEARKFIELENSLRFENPGAFGTNVIIDGGIAKLEYINNNIVYEGDISCGIVITNMMGGKTSWIADKLISTRAPKGRLEEGKKVFNIILKSFKFNLRWFNMYHQLVQYLTQYVMQDIYNAGVISEIIRTTFDQVSDTVRRSYEAQQATNDRVFRGISEGVRGVNSYYDPYKGNSVEIPIDYSYVYANSLGEYIVTDNPNFNPNIGSNINWTKLNRAY